MTKWNIAIILPVFLFLLSCGGTSETPLPVVGRLDYLARGDYFPCSQCHDGYLQKADSHERILKKDHGNIEVAHGRARLWCLVCHKGEKLDFLTGPEGELISFDEGHRLCGSCHTTELEAFNNGKHSKLVTGSDGKPAQLGCTGCHNAHDTHIEPTHTLRHSAEAAGVKK